MNWIRQENDPRYILSEFIQLPSLLTMWGSLGKKIMNGRVGESNIEEWYKCFVNEMRRIFCIWVICQWEENVLV